MQILVQVCTDEKYNLHHFLGYISLLSFAQLRKFINYLHCMNTKYESFSAQTGLEVLIDETPCKFFT